MINYLLKYIDYVYGGRHLNFKYIEAVGFKSFADPVKINFDNGITAIVGPNGCGKSNVADSIRWVLGEQSSKMLRASNMQDVIFKGTDTRKSLSYCEVSLCFDNTNKIFHTPFEEILITRKLYRNGESEYRLNNAPCRLKDIHEILHDSGIGKSGYSIIGQGKVSEILNSKPVDRRAIFEEAAGIAKFKFKKIEAERKLLRTQENLIRIKDVLAEIERQLEPLRKQSENAKKYLELKEQLKLLEVNAYIYEYDNASTNKEEILTKINAIAEDLGFKQEKLENAIKNYNLAFEKINNIDAEISSLRDEVLHVTVELEKQAGQTNVIKEKMRNIESDNARLNADYKRAEENATAYSTDLNDKNRLLNEKIQELSNLKISVSELENKYSTIYNELKSSENEAQRTQQELFETLSKLGDVKAQISALKTEKQNYETKLVELNNDKGEAEHVHKETCLLKQNTISNLEKLNSSLDSLSKILNNLLNEQKMSSSKLKELESNINITNSNILSLQHRKKLLEDMQREYEGFTGSVKRLLTDADKNKLLKDKIVGVFANLIKVPSKYESAIEMALGNSVNNIVTYDEQGAKELVSYLKQKEYGRVTFLPINTIKSRELDRMFDRYLKADGIFGVASELISYDKKISNIVGSFLGTTVIVENMNVAVALAKDTRYSFRIVTLDGDIISPQGSITGGSRKAQITNLLGRESSIEETANNISKLVKEQEELIKQQNELNISLNTLNELVSSKTREMHDQEILRAAENEKLEKLSEECSLNEQRINRLNSEIAKSNQILSGIVSELDKISNINQEYDNTTEHTMNQQLSMFDDLRTKRDKYSDELTSEKIKMAGVESEIVTIKADIARLEIAISTNNAVIDECLRGIEQNNADLSKLNALTDTANTSANVKEYEERLKIAKEQLAKLDTIKIDNQTSLKQLEEDRMNLSAEVTRLQDKKYQQELNLTKIDTDIEQLQERVWEEYELTYSTALEYKQEFFDLKQGLQNITKMKKEISSLGYINVNAIEDYKALQERHGGMDVQAQDLIKAEDDLKKIIKELSNEMINRFETEFNKINENFGKVFKELFGGGSASLELEKGEDVLEAGVIIKANPPGKNLNNISLLSGGEQALTAIAILFAILRLKPMPFCLLDEIEAPLDEANVDRFARYLKRYSNETQFIVITHKKTTMEYADALFGVTMEEKGVSKIVSVKLKDAIAATSEGK